MSAHRRRLCAVWLRFQLRGTAAPAAGRMLGPHLHWRSLFGAHDHQPPQWKGQASPQHMRGSIPQVSVRCEADHTRASRRQLACGVFLKGRPHEEIRLPTHIGSGIGRSRCCCQLVRCYQPHRPNRSCWPKSIPALAIAAPQLAHRREDSTIIAGVAGGLEVEIGRALPDWRKVTEESSRLTMLR
jgi:hypothetical protein